MSHKIYQKVYSNRQAVAAGSTMHKEIRMKNKQDDNEKELAFLKEVLGIENPSPEDLRQALKDLEKSKVISKYTIKSDKV